MQIGSGAAGRLPVVSLSLKLLIFGPVLAARAAMTSDAGGGFKYWDDLKSQNADVRLAAAKELRRYVRSSTSIPVERVG